MRITQILSEMEALDHDRIAAAEGLSPLARSQYNAMPNDQRELQQIIAKLKKPRPTRLIRQALAADPNTRPLLKNLSLGFAEE